MKVEFTNRGFAVVEFTDRHGETCTIQKSSLASEDAIWIGADRLVVKGFVPYGKPDPWTTLSADDIADEFGFTDVVGNQRMHLTQEQVAEILPILQRFAETGDIYEQEATDEQ